jgi:hypothetical protein
VAGDPPKPLAWHMLINEYLIGDRLSDFTHRASPSFLFASVISWPPPTAQQSSLKRMIMPYHNYSVIVRGESLCELLRELRNRRTRNGSGQFIAPKQKQIKPKKKLAN